MFEMLTKDDAISFGDGLIQRKTALEGRPYELKTTCREMGLELFVIRRALGLDRVTFSNLTGMSVEWLLLFEFGCLLPEEYADDKNLRQLDRLVPGFSTLVAPLVYEITG